LKNYESYRIFFFIRNW